MLTCYVALAIAYVDFASVDRCVDAGGVIRDGRCAFTREPFTPLLERGWRVVAITLLIPLVPVLGAGALAWRFVRRRRRADGA